MAGAVLGTYGISRELWPQKSLLENLMDGSPVVGMVKKDTNFGERIRHIVVGYGAPQGLAPTFATAKANKSPSLAETFDVAKRSYYGAFSIDGQLWRTYKHTGDKGVIVSPMVRESKNLLREAKNNLGLYVHGDGGGSIGQLTAASDVTTAQITLTNAADVRNFAPKQKVQMSATSSGGSVLSGTAEVLTVGDEDTPTVTFTAALNSTIAGAVASYYLFREDTYDAAPFLGFDGWNPNHLGSPAAFLNADRTKHPRILAGLQLSATNMGNYQRLFRAARMSADYGYKPDTAFVSTRNWEDLANEQLGAGRLVYDKAPAAPVGSIKLGIEYECIKIMGPRGPIKVVADPWMPDNVERVGELSTLCIASLGDLLHWDDGATPGQPMLEDGADSREVRLVGDMAFINEAPGAWVRIAVAA